MDDQLEEYSKPAALADTEVTGRPLSIDMVGLQGAA